jgi:hypothetical protein
LQQAASTPPLPAGGVADHSAPRWRWLQRDLALLREQQRHPFLRRLSCGRQLEAAGWAAAGAAIASASETAEGVDGACHVSLLLLVRGGRAGTSVATVGVGREMLLCDALHVGLRHLREIVGRREQLLVVAKNTS